MAGSGRHLPEKQTVSTRGSKNQISSVRNGSEVQPHIHESRPLGCSVPKPASGQISSIVDPDKRDPKAYKARHESSIHLWQCYRVFLRRSRGASPCVTGPVHCNRSRLGACTCSDCYADRISGNFRCNWNGTVATSETTQGCGMGARHLRYVCLAGELPTYVYRSGKA